MQFYSGAKLTESSQLEQTANCYPSLSIRPRADHQYYKLWKGYKHLFIASQQLTCLESGRLSSSCHILSWLATSTGRPDRFDDNDDDVDDDDGENDDDEVVEDVAANSTGHRDYFDGHHEDDGDENVDDGDGQDDPGIQILIQL